MADLSVWIKGTQAVEDCLIGDLTREPDIAWSNAAGFGAHQCPPPVRWSSGDVRYAGFSGTLQEVRHWFLWPGKQQRRTSQHSTKIDLQATVAANVVKRAPDHFG